ncbi:MAG: HD-GYP domain-containing protein [Lachnospiraceae bacterium]|nr:HD-GYP domain-containing protein [Lachnospiraceae bacterium]
MHTVKTKDLKPGMITAERVLSKQGQLIVNKDISLTNQMIVHMEYYGVPSAKIVDGMIPTAAIENMARTENVNLSYSQRIQNSSDFKKFKDDYTKKIDFIKFSLNNLIDHTNPVDQAELISQAISLFGKQSTTISMFDKLHNMRQIDDSTYAHSLNVGIIARMFGMWLEYSDEELDILTLAGLMHDIGKCKIPNEIIQKRGSLTKAEYEIVKQHPRLGYELLKDQKVDPRVRNAALMHHERCDGTGYPLGLTTEKIDDTAGIVAIADVYDAMTSNRSYRRGLCPFEVIASFELEGLNRYKPKFILCFLEHIANAYLNNDVLLSNGQTGKIIMITQRLTRPVIQLDEKDFIDLNERPDLYIQAII